jgi:KDO2-lipid IV(A) lauroyltransferase
MAKARKPFVDWLVYAVIRIAVCVIQALPYEAARTFAAGLAWIAYHVDRRHREVARDNLRRAFPSRYTEAEIDQLIRGVYRHFSTLLMEIVHLPRMLHVRNWRRYVELSDGYRCLDCLLADRPLLIVTGHYGNWEMAGFTLGLLGFKAHAVARPLDNPYLDAFLRRFRERTGQKLLNKKGDAHLMLEILQEGGRLATLADQDAGERGLFVDFFGRPASTHKSIALMSLQHRAPLLVCGARKIGEPLRYRIEIADVIYPEDYASRSDAIREITQRFTTALEHLVRLAPEQYLWLHRRWKHQPKVKRPRQAA